MTGEHTPRFAALWRDNEVVGHGDGVKRLSHDRIGPIELEFSIFAVDGRPDLGMIVYNPVSTEGADRIRSLMAARSERRLAELHNPA